MSGIIFVMIPYPAAFAAFRLVAYLAVATRALASHETSEGLTAADFAAGRLAAPDDDTATTATVATAAKASKSMTLCMTPPSFRGGKGQGREPT